MDSLISPKGNQKKEIQYEQTHKIFLSFFGECLMHIRSGLCSVNLRAVGRKPIISRSNVALSEQSFDLQKNAVPAHLHQPVPHDARAAWWKEMLYSLSLRYSAYTDGSLREVNATCDQSNLFILEIAHPLFLEYFGPE